MNEESTNYQEDINEIIEDINKQITLFYGEESISLRIEGSKIIVDFNIPNNAWDKSK